MALGNLTFELGNMTAEQSLAAVTMPGRNGRTPLILAAMVGDERVPPLLWQYGAGVGFNASAARDAGGLTPLMHALRLGHGAVVDWLVTQAGAALTPGDAKILTNLGVD